MKNGPDNLNNDPVAADDRFAGQLGYRTGGRGEPGGIPGDPGGDLAPRNGAAYPAGFPGTAFPGSPAGPPGPVGSVLDGTLARPPAMSLSDLDTLAEPVYPPAGWLDSPSAALADHPLLRGLLLELPPKGSMPPSDWLDRWFEAARSILELLYVQHGHAGGGPR
ncbi:MAG: hypothetical protein AUI14_23195 [Actinobacteria bacterium 13_2_20CM_2_71_6]|nr:MAG: hypothetical protein AUI14_23195 [Actinobacteria bacterium 13_2_20CM_2_71_6]